MIVFVFENGSRGDFEVVWRRISMFRRTNPDGGLPQTQPATTPQTQPDEESQEFDGSQALDSLIMDAVALVG